MKKVVSLFLAFVLTLSLCVPAFALTLKPVPDKTAITAGQDVTVSLDLDEAIEKISTATMRLYFDSNKFVYKSSTKSDVGAYVNKNVKTNAKDGRTYLEITWYDTAETYKIEKGAFVTITFTAQENITDAEQAAFTTIVTELGTTDSEQKKNVTEEASVSVTVTPTSTEPEAKGYTVDAGTTSSTIAVSEIAQVTLKVGNTDSTVSAYNAYDMTVTYDAGVLEYTGAEKVNGETPNVVDNNGTLRITGYGADKVNGTDNIVLNFTGKTTGEAKVAVTSAKVDAKGNAIENDAPEAKLLTAEATITVGGYTVELNDQYFDGATTTTGEKDYTFTPKNADNYDYDITVTVNGTDITDQVTKNADGSYIIPKDQITGNIKISATRIGKTRAVTVAGTGAEDVTAADKATYGTDYTFTVTEQEGYTYTVSAKIGDTTLALTEGANGSYTITGTDLTGDVTITVTKDAAQTDTITIVETGDAWGDVTRSGWSQNGDTIDKSKADNTFSLKIKLATGKTLDDYVVKINGDLKQPMRQGPFWMVSFKPSAVAVGGKITIEVSYKTTEPTITVNAAEYAKLKNGQSIFLITATCEGLAEGKTLTYDGTTTMYWSDKYNAYAWLVISNEGLEKVTAAAKTAVKAIDDEKTAITYDGDVNLTNSVDINDAQLVWNMYNAEYSAFDETVTMLKFLKADMNGDKTLNTNDAAAIVTLFTTNQ